jgi:FtsZ-binding cell division protein ZapB
MADNTERPRLEQAVASLETAVGGVAARLKEVNELKQRNTSLEQEVRTLKTAQDSVSARLDKAIEQLKSLLN